MIKLGATITQPLRLWISDEIQRLEQIAHDLATINSLPFSLEHTVASSCADAPILENWRYAARPVPCLVGNSFGHPILQGDNRPIFTSEVFLISEELGCARTFSRWYRLGRPYGTSEDC